MFDFPINFPRSVDNSAQEKILKIIDRKISKKVFPFVVGIDYAKIDIVRGGFEINILQDTQEAIDIIEYLRERFGKHFKPFFHKSRQGGEVYFMYYKRGEKISNVKFYYKFTIIDKAFFDSHNVTG